jgi:hypothetical protein
MPSPQVVAREPSRRIKKSRKPERRAKQPVDLGDVDMDTPTPSQQSAKAGPGTGAGRERSRRVSERMPKAGGATHQRQASKSNGKGATRSKKNGASKRAAASAEEAPTQKQVLKGRPPGKRKVRDTGVDAAQ